MTRRLSLPLALLFLIACAPPLAGGPQQPLPTVSPATPPLVVATPAAAPTAPPTPAPPEPTTVAAIDSEIERIAANPPVLRDQLALAEAFRGVGEISPFVRTAPLDVQVGDVETFWVTDIDTNTNYQIEAELRYAGPAVLMYVDQSVQVDQADVERSARVFEEQIYPRNREVFGAELAPGVDGDPRLTVLNTALRGAGGYFSATDGVPRAVNRFSNERDMFVMGINSYPLGTPSYAATLAHEFQHMIHQNQQPRSPLWFNEGMSEIAQDVNGYITNSAPQLYLQQPDVQLTAWATSPQDSIAHYGMSHLFMRYVQEQYGGEQGIAELIAADAGNNEEAFADLARRTRPEIGTFADVVADWAVANLINDPSVEGGRYAYRLLPAQVLAPPASGSAEVTVNQFGADYLRLPSGPARLDFDGTETVGLAPAAPASGRYAWWSNRGDEGVQTLTRPLDLRGVSQATLQYDLWYEIELDYDYLFTTVSTDGGGTWTTLQGRATTTEDPQGQNFGNAHTGVSGTPGVETDSGARGAWIGEQMDLTPFAGKEVLLRFWMVNDAGYNAPGALIDNIRVPEIGFSDDAEGDGGWEASGFVRTTGELPQRWTLRLVRQGPGGTAVEPVPTDGAGRATVELGEGERGVLVVLGSTPFTTEPARYQYVVAR